MMGGEETEAEASVSPTSSQIFAGRDPSSYTDRDFRAVLKGGLQETDALEQQYQSSIRSAIDPIRQSSSATAIPQKRNCGRPPSTAAAAATNESNNDPSPDGDGSEGREGLQHQPKQVSSRSAFSTTSSQRAAAVSAIQHKTSSLFRKLVGQSMAQKRDTYVSDAPQQAPARRTGANFSLGRGNRGGIGGSASAFGQDKSNESSAFPQINEERSANFSPTSATSNQILKKQNRCRICTDARTRRIFLAWILYSKCWGICMYVSTFILLFGSQIRFILIPPAADPECDGIFMLTFLLFVADIIMRIDVEACYFVVQIGNLFSWNATPHDDITNSPYHRQNQQQGLGSSMGMINRFQIGSFLFWCDLVSTLSILFEISFCNPNHFREVIVNISLNQLGLPSTGVVGINTGSADTNFPFETNLNLFVTIAKTARVARFIRSTTMIRISSRVNWFWYLNILDPFRWWSDFKTFIYCRLGNEKKCPLGNPDVDFDSPSASHSLRQLGAKTKSVLGTGQKKVARMLRLHKSDSEARKEMMATRIQRAWRRSSTDNKSDTSKGSKANRIDGSEVDKTRNESQVGTAMRELTGQRVAYGIIIAFALTAFFSYTENDATRPMSMIVLHNQTANEKYYRQSIDAARFSAIPDLYYYQRSNGQILTFDRPENGFQPYQLRPREQYVVSVLGPYGNATVGKFSFRSERRQEAFVNLLSMMFILFIWFFGVTAFAGPVMVLVVVPIERMIRLLNMLQDDNVGYEDTPRFKRFIKEEYLVSKNTIWTKEALKGMETSFLMSTILRIGSLMKVGFGSAGVEIVRKNLQRRQKTNVLDLQSGGTQVYCVFLFCDIRQFTDATECLQEEVFVFTNRVAAVVHSICNAYGGSANKNIGDAFLCSWRLEEDPHGCGSEEENFRANDSQADKALYTVVKICMGLYYDKFYVKGMSEQARDALLTKLSKRKGPIVQMGFGLHAGRAVQGAIGSQHKIDATYVSEHVDRSEFLESSTKKYGVMVLMSDSFYNLLDPSTALRCRKVDQIKFPSEDDDDDDDDDYYDDDFEADNLYTFDMEIDALWKPRTVLKNKSEEGSELEPDGVRTPSARLGGRRMSIARLWGNKPETVDGASEVLATNQTANESDVKGPPLAPLELTLPTGPAFYSPSVWNSEEMKVLRQRYYVDRRFFQRFKSGLQSFYRKDWEQAKQCFTTILKDFEDGPSRNFLQQIEENGGIPPPKFRPYGIVT